MAGAPRRATAIPPRSAWRRRSTGAPASRWHGSPRGWRPGLRRALASPIPACWLREDVYAMHGHYSDRHTTVPMFERLGAGRDGPARGRGGRPARSRPRTTRRSSAPMYAWLDAIAQAGGPRRGAGSASGTSARLRRGRRWRAALAAAAAVCAGGRSPPASRRWSAALNRAGLGPLQRRPVLGRRCAARACAAIGEVCCASGSRPPHVVFGHTHRAGPLPADDPAQWRTVTGARSSTSARWVHEPAFVGDDAVGQPLPPGVCRDRRSDDRPAAGADQPARRLAGQPGSEAHGVAGDALADLRSSSRWC